MKINKGQVLERAVRKSALTITELSRLLNTSRRAVYYWFQQQELREEIFEKVGNLIDHDFSAEFSQETEESENEAAPQNAEYWKDKYINLLERYSELLRNKS